VAVVAVAPEAFAAADLALVAFMVVAIVALLVLDTARGPSVRLSGAVPIVGNALAGAVDAAFGASRAAVYTALQASLAAFSRTVSFLQGLWAMLSSTIVGLADLTFAAVHKLEYVVLPHAFAVSTQAIEGLIIDATAEAHSLFRTALAVGAQNLAYAELQIANASIASATFAHGLFAEAEREIGVSEAAAEAYAAQLVAAEHDFAVRAVADIEGYAAGLFAQSIAIGATAEALLRGEIGVVARQDAEALKGGVSALEREIEAAKAALTAAGAISIGVVAAEVAAIRALKCIQQCGPLGALGEGLSLLDLGLILALVGAAQADPKGTQKFLSDNVAPLVQGITKQL
jgi:hypothetical protein